MAVINKVMKWKQLCETLSRVDAEDRIEEMVGELGELMVGLDDRVKPTSTKKSSKLTSYPLIERHLTGGAGLCKVSKSALKSLASQEDISHIVDMYDECLNPLSGDTSQLASQLDTSISVKFGAPLDGVDPGVELEAFVPPDIISKSLGFRNGIPLLFNPYRHKGGVTPWDSPAVFQDVASNAEVFPHQLRWHQLAGTHAILRRIFSREPNSGLSGILVADEVGLGKTLQALAVLAWLTECVGRQSTSRQMPHILCKSSTGPLSPQYS
jgi:TATA-binding protein-associated factor